MQIIDGKKMQAEILEKVREELKRLSYTPYFTDILIGSDPVNAKYVAMKKKTAEEIGLGYKDVFFGEDATESDVVRAIEELNRAPGMAGIIVQLPLPAGFDKDRILNAVSADLDVDVLGKSASEKFYNDKSTIALPTAIAVMKILDFTCPDMDEKKILILGQGPLVGKPVSHLLTGRRIVHNTVTRKTDENEKLALLKNADIVVSAMGVPNIIRGDMLKDGVVVIDAGTSEMEGSIVGDIEFSSVSKKASFITPTPGGVGPVTVGCLFENVLRVAQSQANKS
mgnify:CR=1 FL=1